MSAPRSRSQADVFAPTMRASRSRSNSGVTSPARSSQNKWTSTTKISSTTMIHASTAPSAARPRAVIAVNRASAPRRTSAASVVKSISAAAAPSANQYRRRPFDHGAPVEQQHRRPQRHGENRRAEIRRRHREHRNADHQQHGHDGVRSPDDRAAEREYAPIGRDQTNLRKRINAKQSVAAERNLCQPVGERRSEIAIDRKFMTDGEQLGADHRAGRSRTRAVPGSTARLHQRHQPEQEHADARAALRNRGERRTSGSARRYSPLIGNPKPRSQAPVALPERRCRIKPDS